MFLGGFNFNFNFILFFFDLVRRYRSIHPCIHRLYAEAAIKNNITLVTLCSL